MSRSRFLGALVVLLVGSGCAALIGADFDRPAAPVDAGGRSVEGGNGIVTEVPPPEAPSAGGTCKEGRKLCEGQCFSALDPTHGCGANTCAPCSIPHGAAGCSPGGFCAIGSCEAGRSDCNGNATDGCETAIESSPQDCGGCGHVCGTNLVCAEGECASTCPSGKTACSGACVDLTTTAEHCGTCETECADPLNGVGTCAGGECSQACNAGYRLCDGSCKAESATSCGAGCAVCTAPAHGVAVCTNGACEFTCEAGYQRSGGSCVSPTTGTPPSCAGLAATCGSNGNGDCCASSVVPGGTYNRINDASYPATVSSFRLDTYEITVGRFRKFVGAYAQTMIGSGAGKNPNNGADPGWDPSWNASLPASVSALTAAVKCSDKYQTWTDSAGSNESRPMNCITWYEAEAFCTWDQGRLPTEAEWNYAAAGGSEQRTYPWGSTDPGANANLAVYGCYYNGTGSCSGVTNIAPVGSVSAGNGKWGQADMAGSVWEWTQDWYREPPGNVCNNCADLTASSGRVYRGGSFANDASYLLISDRYYNTPSLRYGNVGARCARTP